MPKIGMQSIRRRQLIEATIATIEAHGFADTTIARISQRARLSSGIIGHYFGGKNALLAATMRSLLSELRDTTLARQRRSGTPIERIEAIVDASFAPEQFTPRVCSVWLAFYAQVPYDPELARLYRVYLRRLHSNLRHAFKALLSPEGAERAAEGMGALIDGIWVRAALSGDAHGEQAHALADDYLRLTLHAATPGGAAETDRARAG